MLRRVSVVLLPLFFFNDTATTEIYTLSLHDALPIKRTPSYFHAVMYSSGRWIIEAARALGGTLEDRDRFLAALRRATDTTPDPRGPIKLDEYGNPTENVYIVRVEKVGGQLQNAVIHTYPMVSQFWTYRPDEFLKTPAYDRNYPPVKP